MFTSVLPDSGPDGGNIDENTSGRRRLIGVPLFVKSRPLLLTSRMALSESNNGAMHLMRVALSSVADTTLDPNLHARVGTSKKPVPEIATDVPPSRNTDRGVTFEIVMDAAHTVTIRQRPNHELHQERCIMGRCEERNKCEGTTTRGHSHGGGVSDKKRKHESMYQGGARRTFETKCSR
jgi:hypothetical protein